MKIISFAWTTPAVVIAHHPDAEVRALAKTCTRRSWHNDYAQSFRVGEVVQAYDRSPRVHGQAFGTLRLTSVDWDASQPDSDWLAEGFEYLERMGIRASAMGTPHKDSTPRQLWDAWLTMPATDRACWVVRFELLTLTAYGAGILGGLVATERLMKERDAVEPRLPL